MTHPKILEKIDWTDLRSQKTTLLETITFLEQSGIKFDPSVDTQQIVDDLSGILALIDALQDYAVDEMGVPEIHVFDFELEEEREQETPTEKFAKESAEKIFNELLESDGFHTDDEMPSQFIKYDKYRFYENIMSNNMHADIIKAKIRAKILNDLKENPEAFDYDDKNVLIYDSRMREDYEGIATSYIKFLFKEIETKTIHYCTHCQSDNVQVKAWTKPNEGQKFVDEVQGDEIGWCDDCQLNSVIDTVSVKVNAKVIGYQVVGEEGTKTEGGIHPDMDGSFCLYSLKQAREMLNDKHNHSSVHDDNWKLLTIWTGDVEEPTFMFEGDPRDEDLGTTDGHIDPRNR